MPLGLHLIVRKVLTDIEEHCAIIMPLKSYTRSYIIRIYCSNNQPFLLIYEEKCKKELKKPASPEFLEDGSNEALKE